MPTSAPRSTSTARTTCEGIRWNPESDGLSHFKIPTSVPSKTNWTGLLSVQTKACGLSCREHGEASVLMFLKAVKDGPTKHSTLDQSSKTHSDICFALVQNAAYFMNFLKWNHLWRQRHFSSFRSAMQSNKRGHLKYRDRCSLISTPCQDDTMCSTITLCVFAVYTNGCRWSILHFQISRFTPNLSQHAAQHKRGEKLSIGSACFLFRY